MQEFLDKVKQIQEEHNSETSAFRQAIYEQCTEFIQNNIQQLENNEQVYWQASKVTDVRVAVDFFQKAGYPNTYVDSGDYREPRSIVVWRSDGEKDRYGGY